MVQRPVRPRKRCSIGRHGELRVIDQEPLLLQCETCGWFLGDPEGLTVYGRERPMLSA